MPIPDSVPAGASTRPDAGSTGGAGASGRSTPTTGGQGSTASKGATAKLAAQIRHQVGRLKDQGMTRAGQFADSGKDQFATKLDDIAGIIGSVAGSTEAQYGPAVGRLAHRAAETVSSAAEGLRSNSVGDLVSGSRTVIRDNPGAAIGAAAVLGFAAARIAKGGLQDPNGETVQRPESIHTFQPAGEPA